MIRKIKRTAIETAVSSPSFVIVKIQMLHNGSPGIRNRLNTTVIISSMTIDFKPRTINLNGTFDIRITAANASAAIRYPPAELNANKEMI